MTIYFQNPGVLDVRLITTLGVNVKMNDSPIGYFGTGLKYALATLLREGCEVEIKTGDDCYIFSTVAEAVRGQDFNFIYMTLKKQSVPHKHERLGFTTELGKNWTVRMAYRELWSNARDEGGDVWTSPGDADTVVKVVGAKIEEAHLRRWEFLLNPEREPIYSDSGVEVYMGASRQVFYRGIAALALNKPSTFTYNILSEQKLTEDRTLHDYYTKAIIINSLAFCIDDDLTEAILLSEGWEKDLDFSYAWSLGSGFAGVLAKVIFKNPVQVNPSAVKMYYSGRTKQKVEYTESKLTKKESQIVHDAVTLCLAAGFDISTFEVVENCGENILGICIDGKIYIARECIKRGCLVEALIEEHTHLTTGFADCSREMQNTYLSHIARFVKAVP